MKRNCFPIFVVGGILLLLGGLAGLQYHWQLQVAEADREKMRKRVEMDANLFADDFNREIQALYVSLPTDSDAWKSGNYAEFGARYDYWRSKTEYPDLVRDIYFIGSAANSPTLRYDRQNKTFTAVVAPPKVDDLRRRLLAAADVRPAYEDLCALAIQVHGPEKQIERIFIRDPNRHVPDVMRVPSPFGYLAVLLDRDVIVGRLLPDLRAKYFGDGEYKVSVSGQKDEAVYGSTTGSDATAPLFDLSPDKFIMFAGRDAIKGAAEIHKSNMVFNQRVETITRSNGEPAPEAGKEMLKVEPRSDLPKPPTPVITSLRQPEGGWKLNVQHRSGSVGAFVESHFRRNVAIGGAVFALLAAAILGIFVSSRRARAYAQRQLDFVSSVSHEFRTPLAVICSAGENLADGVAADAKQVESYGQLIKGEGKKLSTMVEQILEFAGADSGKQKFRFAEVSIGDVVADAVNDCQPLLRSRNFEVGTDIADGLPEISCDKAALAGAVQNLIANSVKYAHDSRWIKVSARNGGDNVRIAVEDHGIGIAPADLRHVFEPFYRSKDVVDAQIHGNGLGLALVKRVAEAHGGRVTAESTVGKGSVFTIELPVGGS